MSTIRIIILTTLFLLLATLPSQPTRALAPSNATQFNCTSVSEIPQPECEALVDLYKSTDGPNWEQKEGWLTTTTPCSWHGVICSDDGSVMALDLDNNDEGNGLTGVLPATVKNLTELTNLDLSHNQLSSIPVEIGNLSNLTLLDLWDNRLSSIPVEISNLSNLTLLDLESNQLSSIPVEIGNLSSLIALSLASNQLSSVPAEIGNLSSLEYLSLSFNQLSSIPVEIGNLSNLIELYLYSNQLSSVPAEIGKLSNLTGLSLDSNRLSSVPIEISNLSNLTTLSLSANQLSSVPAEIGNLSNLTGLSLSSNLLSNVPVDIKNLSNLTKFFISYNRIMATDSELLAFLDERDDAWQTTQTVAPTNIEAIALSDNSIQLTWEPITFTEKGGFYEISMATAGTFTVHGNSPDKSSSSYIISELDPGTTYSIRVRTYTPPHDANPDWTWDNQQNELWSEYSVPISSTTTGQNTTDVSVPSAPAGAHEPNGTCDTAQDIPIDGIVQEHAFQDQGDIDWVKFDATEDTTYRIEIIVPRDSRADVNLELYPDCDSARAKEWSESFSPSVRMDFKAPTTSSVYLKLLNYQTGIFGPDVGYQLSVRSLSEGKDNRALIIVAGRQWEQDHLQDNIHHVTHQVYETFQAYGYDDRNIEYLATDSALAGYDGVADLQSLELAITKWAAEKLTGGGVLNLYMIDHGNVDKLYIDRETGQVLTPELLDGWLTELEDQIDDLVINVIIEACQSGSFISRAGGTISSPGRLIVTSSTDQHDAKASDEGAEFSDQFISWLHRGYNVAASFGQAREAAKEVYFLQDAWLDADGDGRANEFEDAAIASQRGFNLAGTFASDNWPPHIFQVEPPSSVIDLRGTIYADVRDDENVESVWAVIYLPSYTPPETANQLQPEQSDKVDKIILSPRPDRSGLHSMADENRYGGSYNFIEQGEYRVIIYAEDRQGLNARPVSINFIVGPAGIVSPVGKYQLYLPVIQR